MNLGSSNHYSTSATSGNISKMVISKKATMKVLTCSFFKIHLFSNHIMMQATSTILVSKLKTKETLLQLKHFGQVQPPFHRGACEQQWGAPSFSLWGWGEHLQAPEESRPGKMRSAQTPWPLGPGTPGVFLCGRRSSPQGFSGVALTHSAMLPSHAHF